ncbi:hypothetical protein B0H10DRAFT_1966963 [Mycena sp. CBHHK59/15]|nr:hypothetical protein B0H10DRAFT_1966963 [Mycena sp. CBHHK59/15]
MAFAMTTAYTAAWFQGFFKEMHVLFEENTEDPLTTRIDLANQSVMGANNLIILLGGNGTGLIYLIGETVSIWRAWAILAPNRKPVYGLILHIVAHDGNFGTGAIEGRENIDGCHGIGSRILHHTVIDLYAVLWAINLALALTDNVTNSLQDLVADL